MRLSKKVKRLLISLFVVFVVTAVGPCSTITHEYGPYFGQVVDSETGDPIEGAYILVAFYTRMYTLGGFTSHFVEVRDAMTDNNGEFRIEPYRAWAFRFPHKWDSDCDVTIYKPGYADWVPDYVPNYSIPTNKHITIRLITSKKLEERGKPHSFYIPHIPDEKLRKLHEMIRQEEIRAIEEMKARRRGRK